MFAHEIKEAAFALKEHLIEIRRDLHRYPEPAREEFRTQEKVIAELKAIGITEMKTYYKTGVAATIRGEKPGKTIAIRADMDALNVTEETGLEFSSLNQGVSHACGHDGHVAMLLGAGRILYNMRTLLQGNVKLIFQPAEEDGLHGGGAQWMVNEGVLADDPQVDFIIGQHIAPNLRTGIIASKSGPIFATSDLFTIEIIGQGGHSSTPHLTKDPIVCAAQVVLALQTVVARNVDPLETVVLSIGVFEAGSRHNIIPDSARLIGSARSYTEENSALSRKRIREIVEGICQAHNQTAKIEFTKGYSSVINDAAMYEKAKHWGSNLVGKENFIVTRPLSSGEDFSNYLSDIPGVYFLIGAKYGEEEERILHSPTFTFDEDALPYGVMNFCSMAVNYLNEESAV